MGLMAWYIGLLLLLFYVLESLPQESICVRLPDIYWNATNPIFRIDNTDHIIDVNRDNMPYDQVNIICPVYTTGTSEEETEKYIIYNVSKEEYDTCRITNPNPRIIAVCDKPYKVMYFTITFRSFTPQPGGLEFRPGQDYYFISTSSRDDLHRRVGGRCSSHNMKVVFKVCCNPGETSPTRTTQSPDKTTTWSTSTMKSTGSLSPRIIYTSPIWRSSMLPPMPSTTRRPQLPHTPFVSLKPYNRNISSNPRGSASKPMKPSKPRKNVTRKQENEVVKNEELTSRGTSNHCSALLVSLVSIVLVTIPKCYYIFLRLS